MAERSLRGARLGAQSFEDERGVEMAARQDIVYVCPDGHRFSVMMADEAEVPDEWEDPKTGQVGRRLDSGEAPPKVEKHVRTHWDMLLERRSIPELEELLEERLELLRASGGAPRASA